MFSPKRYYQFINLHKHKSLRPEKYGTGSGNHIYLTPSKEYAGNIAQWAEGYHWQILPVDGDPDHHYIINRNSGKYLRNGKDDPGAVWQDKFSDKLKESGKDRFRWKFLSEESPVSHFTVQNKKTGNFLTAGRNNPEKVWVAKPGKYGERMHFVIQSQDVTDQAEAYTPRNEVTSCTSCHQLVHVNISPDANHCPATGKEHTLDPKSTPILHLTEFGAGSKENRESLHHYNQLSDCINCGTIFGVSGGGLEKSMNDFYFPRGESWCSAQDGGHVPSRRRYLVKPTAANGKDPESGTKTVYHCDRCSSVTDQRVKNGKCKPLHSDNGQPIRDHAYGVQYTLAVNRPNPWDQVFDPPIPKQFPAFSTGKQAEILKYLREKLSRNLDPGKSIRDALVDKNRFGVLHADLLRIEEVPDRFTGFEQDWNTVFKQIHQEIDIADRVHQYFDTLDKLLTDAALQMTWATSENSLRLDAENEQEVTETQLDPVEALLFIFGKLFTALSEAPEIGMPFEVASKGVDLIELLVNTIKKHAAEVEEWQAQDPINVERAEIWKKLSNYITELKDRLSKQKRLILTNWGMLEQAAEMQLDLDDQTKKALTDAMVASFSLHVYQILFASRFILVDALNRPNSIGVSLDNFYKPQDLPHRSSIHPAILHVCGQRREDNNGKSRSLLRFLVKKEAFDRLSQNFLFATQLDTSFLPSENLMQEVFRRPPVTAPDQTSIPMGTRDIFDSDALFFGVGGWHTLSVRKMWAEWGSGNSIGLDFAIR